MEDSRGRVGGSGSMRVLRWMARGGVNWRCRCWSASGEGGGREIHLSCPTLSGPSEKEAPAGVAVFDGLWGAAGMALTPSCLPCTDEAAVWISLSAPTSAAIERSAALRGPSLGDGGSGWTSQGHEGESLAYTEAVHQQGVVTLSPWPSDTG